MIAVLFAAAVTSAPAPIDGRPRSYLASITIPLEAGERIDGSSFSTWGVRFAAVCRIPPGWRITAGGGATPEGVLSGEGGQGVTWLDRNGLRHLQGLVLVTIHGRVQRRDIKLDDKGSVIPATFKGRAHIQTLDAERTVKLTAANVRLVPARRCGRPG